MADALAGLAYEVADSMIAERGRPREGPTHPVDALLDLAARCGYPPEDFDAEMLRSMRAYCDEDVSP